MTYTNCPISLPKSMYEGLEILRNMYNERAVEPLTRSAFYRVLLRYGSERISAEMMEAAGDGD